MCFFLSWPSEGFFSHTSRRLFFVAFLLDSCLVISSICLVDSLRSLKVREASYPTCAFLSLQFLAEDYTLVDVLYYVTRDDLKCLRLRYHFPPFHACHEGKEPWVENRKSGFLLCRVSNQPGRLRKGCVCFSTLWVSWISWARLFGGKLS